MSTLWYHYNIICHTRKNKRTRNLLRNLKTHDLKTNKILKQTESYAVFLERSTQFYGKIMICPKLIYNLGLVLPKS